MSIKQHINCKNLAKSLDVTARTIRNWASDGVSPLPAKKVNGVWLFECEAVEKWLKKRDSDITVDVMVNEILSNL